MTVYNASTELFRFMKYRRGVNEMIGRNDPCLCGSGKKYKKCCLRNNEASIDELIEQDLERILRSYYERPRSRGELLEYDKYRKVWNDRLNKHWDEKSIDVATTEYFIFIEKQHLWAQYVDEVLAQPIRDAVRDIIEHWKNPVVLFGKVAKKQGNQIEVQEIVGDESFTLEVNDAAEEGLLVFGIGLRNNRRQDNGLYTLTSFMFIKDVNQTFEHDVVNLMNEKNLASTHAFYRQHMVDVYQFMFDRDNTTKEDLISEKLSDDQQAVLTLIDEELTTVEASTEEKELLQNITITYFMKENPRFRKPNVIAAAVFNIAIEMKMLGELTMTNREVAERFDVSTSSVKTQADRVREFVKDMLGKTVAE